MLLLENHQVSFKFDPGLIEKSNPDLLTRIIANHPILRNLSADTEYYLPYVTDANKRRFTKDKLKNGYIHPLELVEDYFLGAKPILPDIDETKLFDISDENIVISKRSSRIRSRKDELERTKNKDYNLNRVALLVSYQNFLNGYIGTIKDKEATQGTTSRINDVKNPLNYVKIHSAVLKGHFTELFVRLYYSYRLPRDNSFFEQNQAEIFDIINSKILKGQFLFSNFQNKDERRQYNSRQHKEILMLFIFATFNLAKNLRFDNETISMSPSRGERDMLMVIGENYKKVLEQDSDWSEKYTRNISSFITKLGLSGYRSKTIRALENDALYHGREAEEKEEFVAKKANVESFFRQCARIAELYEDEEMEKILEESVKKEIDELYNTLPGKKIRKYLDKLKEETNNYKKIFITSIIVQTYKKFANEFIKEVSDLKFKNFIYNEKKILLTAFKEDITFRIFVATKNTRDFVIYIKEFLNENLREYYEEEDEELSEQDLLEIKVTSQKELAELFTKDIVQVIPDLFGNISIDKFPGEFVEAFKSLLVYQFESSSGEKINVPIPDLSKDESSFLFSSMGVDIYDNVEKTFDELLSGLKDYAEDSMERPKRTYVNYNSNEEYEHYNYKLKLLIDYISTRESTDGELRVGSSVLRSLYNIKDFISARQYFTEHAKDRINIIYNQLFQGKKAFETITNFEKAMASIEIEEEKIAPERFSKKIKSKKKMVEPASDNFEQSLEEHCRFLASGEIPEDEKQFATALTDFAEHFFKAVLNFQNTEDDYEQDLFQNIIDKMMEIVNGVLEFSKESQLNTVNVLESIVEKISDKRLQRGCGIFAYFISSSLSGDIILPRKIVNTLESATSQSFVRSLQNFVDSGSDNLKLSAKEESYFNFSEEIPEAPEEIPEAPEEIPEAPEEIPEAPEEIPEKIPEAPEEIPEAPEEIPEAPEKIPEAPEEIPEAPEEIPEAPEKIPEAPEEIPEKIPEAPEEIPEKIPEAPEEIPERKYKTKPKSETIAQKALKNTRSSDEKPKDENIEDSKKTEKVFQIVKNTFQDYRDSEEFDSIRKEVAAIEYDDEEYDEKIERLKEFLLTKCEELNLSENQKEALLRLAGIE